jgi:hypothetical protein
MNLTSTSSEGGWEGEDDDDEPISSSKSSSSSQYTKSSWEYDRDPSRRVHKSLLLDTALSRAHRTLTTTNWLDDDEVVVATNKNTKTTHETIIIDAAISRSAAVLSGKGNAPVDNDDDDKKNNHDVETTMTFESSTTSRTSSSPTASPSSDDVPSHHHRRHRRHPMKTITGSTGGGGGVNVRGGGSAYLDNPCVTLTALAHSLWRNTIRSHNDIVIDATCGNGRDLVALAGMLFPPPSSSPKNDDDDPNGDDDDDIGCFDSEARLIGIDVQSRAIYNAERMLTSSFSSYDNEYRDGVSLVIGSHENLMDVVQSSRCTIQGGVMRMEDDIGEGGRDVIGVVGLVCYNLGFLPGANDNSRRCMTQSDTTMRSITDAVLLLRVGGLLSVMTYPGSNYEESVVVERFVEGLGMLTTRNEGGWRGYANSIPDDDGMGGGDGRSGSSSTKVRTMVTMALEQVVSKGAVGQTWRAFVHRPLGRPLSPVLVTATRIK